MNGSEIAGPNTAYIDANVLLRVLLNDNVEQATRANRYLRLPVGARPQILLDPATLSEVIFVLTGPRLAIDRAHVVEYLEIILLMPVEIVRRHEVLDACALYQDSHDDWDDCLLAAYALRDTDGAIVSFDQKLGAIPGISRIEP